MIHTNLFVTPREGYKVRDPAIGDHLPADGRLVVETTYWQRRILDGDVTSDPKKAEAAKLEAERVEKDHLAKAAEEAKAKALAAMKPAAKS